MDDNEEQDNGQDNEQADEQNEPVDVGTDAGMDSMDNAGDMPAQGSPSRLRRILASIPTVPEYPIPKPVDNGSEDNPDSSQDDDNDEDLSDLTGVSEEDMDDLVGTEGSEVDVDLSGVGRMTPEEEDYLFGTGPELPKKKKTTYSTNAKRKRQAESDEDQYLSGML